MFVTMLDKSLPWHSFIMSLEPSHRMQQVVLPEGYSIRPYEGEQDELAWAKIETAVGEFDSVEEAVQCHKHYLAELEELKKRQWFVVDEYDRAVATCTVWWSGEDKVPCIHALSCLPELQGKGLGKAVAIKAISSTIMEDKRTIWLETQTWSWKAISLYLGIGFVPHRKVSFNETLNEFETAYEVISTKLDENICKRINELAID